MGLSGGLAKLSYARFGDWLSGHDRSTFFVAPRERCYSAFQLLWRNRYFRPDMFGATGFQEYDRAFAPAIFRGASTVPTQDLK